MAKLRPYLIHHKGKPVAFVHAMTKAQAIGHHVRGEYEAVAADADHVFAHPDLPRSVAGADEDNGGDLLSQGAA